MLLRTDNMHLQRRTPTAAPLFPLNSGTSRKMHSELCRGGKRVREEVFGERPTRSNGWYGTGLWVVGGNGSEKLGGEIVLKLGGTALCGGDSANFFDLTLISAPGLLWQAGRCGFDDGHSAWPNRRWSYGVHRDSSTAYSIAPCVC